MRVSISCTTAPSMVAEMSDSMDDEVRALNVDGGEDGREGVNTSGNLDDDSRALKNCWAKDFGSVAVSILACKYAYVVPVRLQVAAGLTFY